MDLQTLGSIVMRVARKIYPRLGLRDSDIILASFPKSGNTWVRFIWANIVSLKELGGQPIDFPALDNRLGSEFDNYSYSTIEFECLPRLVKTHEAYDPVSFGRQRCVYLHRHPGDVMVSYHAYLSARRDTRFREVSLSEFIRDPEVGLPAWGSHVRNWLHQADTIITYENFKSDAVSEMRRVLKSFNLEHIESDVLQAAVSLSTFERVRQFEERSGRHDEDRFDSDFKFTRSGAVGQWQHVMSESDRKYLNHLMQKWGLQSLYRESLMEHPNRGDE